MIDASMSMMERPLTLAPVLGMGAAEEDSLSLHSVIIQGLKMKVAIQLLDTAIG